MSSSNPSVTFSILTNHQERLFESVFMVDENGSQLIYTYTRADGDFHCTNGYYHHRNARRPRQDNHPLRRANVQDFSGRWVGCWRAYHEPCPYTNTCTCISQRPSYSNHVRHLDTVYEVLDGASFNFALVFCFANKPERRSRHNPSRRISVSGF